MIDKLVNEKPKVKPKKKLKRKKKRKKRKKQKNQNTNPLENFSMKMKIFMSWTPNKLVSGKIS